MAHDYRRGTKATEGARVLGAVGGVRKDTPGSLAGEDGTYAEAQFDQQGNVRVADAVLLAVLDELVAMNAKLDLLVAALAN